MGNESALGEIGLLAVERVAGALGLRERIGDVRSTFEVVSASWAARPRSDRVASFHTPDGSPLELSTPLAGSSSELRFTVEPQAAPYGHRANWKAAVATLEALRDLPGVSLEAIEPALAAFEPPGDDAFGFALWIGVAIKPSGPPVFKVYFNASFAADRGKSWQDVVAAAAGIEPVRAVEGAVPDPRHVGIVAYDLVAGAGARVKLYVAHGRMGPRSSPIDLAGVERVEALGRHSRAGDARALLEHFAPESVDPTSSVPVFVGSTIHIVGAAIDRVTTNACFLPFGPGAPPEESVRLRRVEGVAQALGARAERLGGFLEAVAPSSGTSLTYLSVQREGDRPRLTAYASPLLYGP